jgi:hypothetical protein
MLRWKTLVMLVVIAAMWTGHGPAQAASIESGPWTGSAAAAALQSVDVYDVPDPRLWGILGALSQQQGISLAGGSAYIATSISPDMLIVPLARSPESDLILFFQQAAGEYLFLMIDRSQVSGPQVHLWGAGQEELLITQAGLQLLPTKSEVTFRLSGGQGASSQAALPSSGGTTGLFGKLKCYLASLGIKTYTLTSLKQILSDPGICSEFNVISIVLTGVSCLAVDLIPCLVGVDTITACLTCDQPGTTYSIGGNAGVAGATITVGGASVTAGSSGHYSITGLVGGAYTITATKSGCTFSPPSRTVTLPPNATAQNFAASCQGSPAPVSWTVTDACPGYGGLYVRFYDSLGHVYPTNMPYFQVPDKGTETFSAEVPAGATVCLGAVDVYFTFNWCVGIDGNIQTTNPACCATVTPGGISKSIRLTC